MTDSAKKTKKSQGGQIGNQNAVAHGLRASKLPDGNAYIDNQTRSFRRYCREMVIERDGQCGVYSEAILQSAVRHEQRALLAAKWLREKDPELEIDQKLKLLDTISKATDSRDKCLEKLKLDTPSSDTDPWAAITFDASPSAGLADQKAPRKAESEKLSECDSSVVDAPESVVSEPGKAHTGNGGKL